MLAAELEEEVIAKAEVAATIAADTVVRQSNEELLAGKRDTEAAAAAVVEEMMASVKDQVEAVAEKQEEATAEASEEPSVEGLLKKRLVRQRLKKQQKVQKTIPATKRMKQQERRNSEVK